MIKVLFSHSPKKLPKINFFFERKILFGIFKLYTFCIFREKYILVVLRKEHFCSFAERSTYQNVFNIIKFSFFKNFLCQFLKNYFLPLSKTLYLVTFSVPFSVPFQMLPPCTLIKHLLLISWANQTVWLINI